MQDALETLARYKATQPPPLDIARRLHEHYNGLLVVAQQKNPHNLWANEMQRLAAQYPKDLEEYNKQAQWLLGRLNKAMESPCEPFTLCVKCKESQMKQMAWDDFVALLRYKEYPVVLTMGEAREDDGYGSWTQKVVTLTTPLQ